MPRARNRAGDAAELPALTASLLREMALPQPDEGGDKEERGRVLVVAGAPEMPGAAILAATAALRAGAGKLRIATCRSVAGVVAAAVPEARVYAFAETRAGGISPSGARRAAELANAVQALLVGPGMLDAGSSARLVERLLGSLEGPTTVLDAVALAGLAPLAGRVRGLGGAVVLTPHEREMAMLLEVDAGAVARDRRAAALSCAERFGAVVALKGRETYVASPDGTLFVNRAGNVGLATSGSGDTLAGVVAGLAARGADPLRAAAWGVFLHAAAGDRLAERIGPLGYLARELLAEIPRLMADVEAGRL